MFMREDDALVDLSCSSRSSGDDDLNIFPGYPRSKCETKIQLTLSLENKKANCKISLIVPRRYFATDFRRTSQSTFSGR